MPGTCTSRLKVSVASRMLPLVCDMCPSTVTWSFVGAVFEAVCADPPAVQTAAAMTAKVIVFITHLPSAMRVPRITPPVIIKRCSGACGGF